MVDLTTLVAYGAVVLGFVFIPGPATLLTVARATSSGTRVGIATGVGIAAGDMIHTFMAIVGISAVIATSAVLFSIIKYIGAAYLVYLGIRAMLERTPANLTAGTLPISAGKAVEELERSQSQSVPAAITQRGHEPARMPDTASCAPHRPHRWTGLLDIALGTQNLQERSHFIVDLAGTGNG